MNKRPGPATGAAVLALVSGAFSILGGVVGNGCLFGAMFAVPQVLDATIVQAARDARKDVDRQIAEIEAEIEKSGQEATDEQGRHIEELKEERKDIEEGARIFGEALIAFTARVRVLFGIEIFCHLILAIGLLVGGIGMLRGGSKARKALVLFGGGKAAYLVVMAIFGSLYLAQAAEDLARAMEGSDFLQGQDIETEFGPMDRASGAGQAVTENILGIVLAVAIVITATRPESIAYCGGGVAPEDVPPPPLFDE